MYEVFPKFATYDIFQRGRNLLLCVAGIFFACHYLYGSPSRVMPVIGIRLLWSVVQRVRWNRSFFCLQ